MNFPAPDRLLKMPEVEAMTGLSRSTLYEMMKKGTFPASVVASTRSVRWRESDVSQWMNALPKGRAA